MRSGAMAPATNDSAELGALIATMHETERRLEELTGGEVDTVAGPDGRVFTLRRAQDQVRHAEYARQSAILNALPANIALLDPDGVVISVNDAWRHFADANAMSDPERGVGRSYLRVCDEAVGPDAVEIREIGAGLRSLLSGREHSFSREYSCHSPTERRWFLLKATPLIEGELCGVVGMHLDITARTEADRAAARALERLNEAQQIGRIGDWDFELATQEISWSPQVFEIFGRDPKLGPPKNLEQNDAIFDRASAARLQEQIALAISSGLPREYGLVVPRTGDLPVTVWAVAVPIRNESGEVYRIHGTVQDISAREQAQAQIAERQAELQETQRLAGIGSWLVDFDRKVVRRSAATSSIFGLLPHEDIVGIRELTRGLENVLTPDSFQRMESTLRHSRESGDSYEAVLEMIRPDQSRGWVLSRGEAVVDADGRVRALRGTALDITERKRSEFALAELSEKTERRERMLSALLSSISDFAYIYDREGRFLFVNQPLLDLWGIPLEAAIGKDFFDLGYPEALAIQLQREVQIVFETKSNVTGETPYVSPSGVAGFYEYIFSPVIGADGAVELVAGSTRDITERKRVEHELRESERLFSTAFEYAPIAVALVSLDGRWLRVNRALCELFGYTEAELLTGSFSDVTHPDDLRASWEHMRRMVAGELPSSQLEKRYVARSGNVIDGVLSISLVRDADGLPRYFVGQIEDVTERKRAEDELRASHQKFLQLADNITDAFWIRSADMQQVHYISPAFETIWGRTVESLYNDPQEWIDFILPADRVRVLASFASLVKDAPAIDVEYRIVRSDGEIRWIRSRGFQVRDDAGIVIRTIGIVSDITDQRRAEAELRASEEEFRTLAEAMPQIVWITRPDGGNIYCNQQWMDYTGLTGEESRDSGWNRAFHPDDQRRALEEWEHAVAEMNLYSVECRLRRADGAYRWWLIRGMPLRDVNGGIIKWFGTCTDIHDMKVAEMEILRSNRALNVSAGALREGEKEQRQLAEQLKIERTRLLAAQQVAKVGSCETDLNTMTSIWSEETHRIFETDSRIPIVTREAFFARVHPDDRADVNRALQSSIAKRQSSSIEHRLLLPDGRIKFVEQRWHLVLDGEGAAVKTVGTCQDVTERKLAEIAMQQSQQRLRDIIDGLGPSMFVALLTPEGILVEINRPPLEAAGLKAGDVLGKPFVDTPWWNYAPEAQQQLSDAIFRAARGEASRYDAKAKGAGVTFIDLDLSLQPLRDESGKVVFLIQSASVITERKRAEGALRQAQKMEAVGQLAAGVAHEFNNILQTLMSMATIARLHGVSPEIVKIASEMEVQIRRGASVTQQLVLSSRHQELTKTNLDLSEQVGKTRDLLRRLLPENIRISVETPRDRASVEGDAGQVQQVLLNLAINARDAMPEGGTLTMRVACQSTEVSVDVEDTGVGFDAHTADHLFEPFFTTKEVGKGTGLGLAVVYGIIQQHGGRIDVQSHPGKGSRFRIILPRTADPETVEETRVVSLPQKAEGRILLVEDEEAVREGLEMLLEILGYEVIAVPSAEEALQQPLIPVPDLLLSDVSLPGMGGPRLAQLLRERWPLMKITLMTGFLESATRQSSLAQGWQILQKPFELDALSAHLIDRLNGNKNT